MVQLEDILAEVRILCCGLGAEIIVSPEEGHYVDVEVVTGGWYSSGGSITYGLVDEWVVTKPEVRVPDHKKREESRSKLHGILDACEWYSGRYAAGIWLKLSNEDLLQRAHVWVDELKKELRTRPDKAQTDLGHLYHSSLYTNSHLREIRVRAGRLLGIEEAEILVRELHYSERRCTTNGAELEEEQLRIIYKFAKNASDRQKAGECLVRSLSQVSTSNSVVLEAVISELSVLFQESEFEIVRIKSGVALVLLIADVAQLRVIYKECNFYEVKKSAGVALARLTEDELDLRDLYYTNVQDSIRGVWPVSEVAGQALIPRITDRDELERIYNDSRSPVTVRDLAGKALGYSALRLLYHGADTSGKAMLMGCLPVTLAMAGGISYGIYRLVEHFTG